MKLRPLFFAATAAILSAACGGPGPEQATPEPTSSSTEAMIYDPSYGCTLVNPSRATIAARSIGVYGEPTANGLYGYPGCLNQDVVDFTSVYGANYHLRVQWADTAITNPTACKTAEVGGEAYGLMRELDGTSSAYVFLGRASAHGEWFSSWTGSYCWLVADVADIRSSQFVGVRVIGTATRNPSIPVHDRVIEVLERDN